MRNAGSTIRRQGSGRPHNARTDDNVYFVNELILSQEGAPKNHKTTCRQISRKTGIHHSSVYRIVRQIWSWNVWRNVVGKKSLCKLCVAPNSRTKTATSFPSIRCGLHIFTDDVKAGRLFEHLIFDRLLLWFAFISYCLFLASDFAALCLCQQWLYLACFLLGLQLNTIHQY